MKRSLSEPVIKAMLADDDGLGTDAHAQELT